MTSETKPNEKPLPDDQQWQLALAYLRRADESANYLRTLLFAAASGLIIYALPQIKMGIGKLPISAHVLTVLCCAVAVGMLVHSWQLQKKKARERFKYLRAKNYEIYTAYNSAIDNLRRRQNRHWDWAAFWLIATGLMMELVVRLLAAGSAPHILGRAVNV